MQADKPQVLSACQPVSLLTCDYSVLKPSTGSRATIW